jgi:hypothetical protein
MKGGNIVVLHISGGCELLARRRGIGHGAIDWSLLVAMTTLLTLGAGTMSGADEAGAERPSGDSSPTSAAPTVTLDESQFNLFNPTPEDALRPFSTDRPGKTHSSLTVDAGHFQLEGDFWNYTWDHWTKDESTLRATTVINPNLKLGIAAEFEASASVTCCWAAR